MTPLKSLVTTATLMLLALGSQAHAAKIFTINGTIAPDQDGYGYSSDVLPFPSFAYTSSSQGLNFRFSSPIFATVTIWPPGDYDYFGPDGEIIPVTDSWKGMIVF